MPENFEQQQPLPQTVSSVEKISLALRDPTLIDRVANPIEDLENLEHLLRSEMPMINIEGKKVWVIKPDISKPAGKIRERNNGKFTGREIPIFDKIPPMMNEMGISDTITYLSTIMTKSTTLSYFKEDEIKQEVFWCWSDWRVTLLQKRKGWGIDPDKVMLISGLIWNCINILIRRAREGRTLDSISESSKEQQILYEKPKSIIQKMPFLGGRV